MRSFKLQHAKLDWTYDGCPDFRIEHAQSNLQILQVSAQWRQRKRSKLLASFRRSNRMQIVCVWLSCPLCSYSPVRHVKIALNVLIIYSRLKYTSVDFSRRVGICAKRKQVQILNGLHVIAFKTIATSVEPNNNASTVQRPEAKYGIQAAQDVGLTMILPSLLIILLSLS